MGRVKLLLITKTMLLQHSLTSMNLYFKVQGRAWNCLCNLYSILSSFPKKYQILIYYALAVNCIYSEWYFRLFKEDVSYWLCVFFPETLKTEIIIEPFSQFNNTLIIFTPTNSRGFLICVELLSNPSSADSALFD